MIKLVTFQGFRSAVEDCIVLRKLDQAMVEIAFPFNADQTPIRLSGSEVFSLRNALDEILDVRALPYKID